ncbi:uncharacterized protein LOC133629043 [Colius striatus]|uniref:uncharacterized protein LOC133629043 n=1 Tax=Colius striatus TaxID=57412 RepID=UPI002B1D1EDE|nr:uncharacterized protein LOC133629043 [Colius striatus]
MERCNQSSGGSDQWCQRKVEVVDLYKPRASVSQGASLVLQDAHPDDAGVYQLMVQTLDMVHTTQVTLILQGTFSPFFLSSSPAHAHPNQTAQLSFSLQPPSSSWDFICITWELISSPRNLPILNYTLDGCQGEAQDWWRRSCRTSWEVAELYRQRVDVEPNGTLKLREVQDEDTGTYLVTVRAPEGLACVAVNLSMSRAERQK